MTCTKRPAVYLEASGLFGNAGIARNDNMLDRIPVAGACFDDLS